MMKRISTCALVAAGLLALPAALAAQTVNDAQIAAIVVTANQVDIDAGKLAETNASDAKVKAFGKQMVTDHTGVNKQATDLVTKLGVTPQDNPTAQSLKSGGADNVKHLSELKGKDFDRGLRRSRGGLPPAGARRAGQDADPQRAEQRPQGLARQGQTGVRCASRTREDAADLAREVAQIATGPLVTAACATLRRVVQRPLAPIHPISLDDIRQARDAPSPARSSGRRSCGSSSVLTVPTSA